MNAGTATRVVSQLAGVATTVRGPDHPLLLDGPDYLAASPGGVMDAFFVLRAAEKRSAVRLAGRLALAKLAYPDNVRWTLVADEDIPWLDRAERDFDRLAIARVDGGLVVREASTDRLNVRQLNQFWA